MLLSTLIELAQIFKECSRDILEIQGNHAKTVDSMTTDLRITVIGVLIQFVEHISKVVLACQGCQNFQLDNFDVRWFINFEVKILEICFEDRFSFQDLDDMPDVLQDNECCLWGSSHLTRRHQS